MQDEHKQLGEFGAIPGVPNGPPNDGKGSAAIEFHPVANLFPPMSDKDYHALKASIKANNGLTDPIWMYQGKLIDGRHRLRACAELGIPPRFQEWDGKGTLLEFVLAQNLHRRHLKEAQRAMVAARIKPQFEEDARKRQQFAGKELSDNCREVQNPADSCPEGRASDNAGKVLSVSGRSVERACKILDKGVPALIAAVETCQIAVSTAADLAELPKEEQTRLLATGSAEIRKALQPIREARKKKPGANPQPAESRCPYPPLPEELEQRLMSIFNNGWVKLTKHGDGYRMQFSEYYLDEMNRAVNRPVFKHLLDRGVLMVRVEKGTA